MRRTPKHLFLLILAGSLAVAAAAHAQQAINADLLRSRWQASWIRPAGAPPKAFGVYHFRKIIDLETVPSPFVVHASADNRYVLFVNGTRVLAGPARGDLNHWRFETADIAPLLRPGRNLLAAVAWNFAEHAPMAQVTHESGFILQGNTPAESAVNTDRSWRALRNEGITLRSVDRAAIFHQYFVAGPGEEVDAARMPWGWELPEFDDREWGAVDAITIGGPRGIRDSPSRWMLVPSGIPQMEARLDRFARVAASAGGEPPAGFLEGRSPWTVPPRMEATVLLDRGHLTTAYPEVVTSGGHGAVITVTYAEALHEPPVDGRRGRKGHRDEVAGKVVTGLQDRFLSDGGASRLFRPLWWRTYRYVEARISTAGEPLVIHDIRGEFTAYPFEARGRFESDDPTLAKIWEVGWRTARVCAHETYVDTPYWEQLQYVGDTRIQALLSLYVGGDDRLVRNAIALFDQSRITDGLTQSRYPTMLPQIIPPFSLLWIGMMHDLYWWGGDERFLAAYLPGARGVLEWFERRLAPSGLLGPLEWWDFVDWVEATGWDFGEPPFDRRGESAILSLQFVLALREAAALEAGFGSTAQSERYRLLADAVARAVRDRTWDGAQGLFADTPARRSHSQHVNALAALADIVPEADQPAFMRRVLEDRSLTQATYYFRFYVLRASKKARLGDDYLAQLGPWRQMLDLGLTTWAEKPEPTRSDSHAWSAHPNYDLLTTVAGVEPATPGFATVRITPHLGALTTVRAVVPTPRGHVRVSYQRAGDRLEAEVTLPQGVRGTLEWKGRRVALEPGTQRTVF